MACFLVPGAQAVVTKVVEKVVEKKEQNTEVSEATVSHKIPFSRKLKWLSRLLMGGFILLMYEHLWHGEISPQFPFITAADGWGVVLSEMATTGVAMCVVCTVVWLAILAVVREFEKKEVSESETAEV